MKRTGASNGQNMNIPLTKRPALKNAIARSLDAIWASEIRVARSIERAGTSAIGAGPSALPGERVTRGNPLTRGRPAGHKPDGLPRRAVRLPLRERSAYPVA